MKLLLVLKKHIHKENNEFCPFCGERDAFYDINPYQGEIELDESELNVDNWLLP